MLNNLDHLKSIAHCIATQFGPSTEVVVHDFRNGFENTIVHIENGYITGRKKGGCPTTLFLKEIQSKNTIEKLRYITQTPDGKTLRSSTVNFFEEDKLVGSICINQDISDYLLLEKATKNLAATDHFEYKPSSIKEIHSASIHELLESLISEGLNNIGVPVSDMNKESKMKLLKFLDEKGVFLIKKSGERLCELLSISKFTLYNYLDEIRKST